jgi:branched-chain amino acid transport system substrate-binding protein
MERTRPGRALRAAADNPIAATYMGIDVDRAYRLAFGLGDGAAAAIHTMNITDGSAIYFPGHHIEFDAKGRRIGAQLVMVQWLSGRPVIVFPEDMAAAKAVWPVTS